MNSIICVSNRITITEKEWKEKSNGNENSYWDYLSFSANKKNVNEMRLIFVVKFVLFIKHALISISLGIHKIETLMCTNLWTRPFTTHEQITFYITIYHFSWELFLLWFFRQSFLFLLFFPALFRWKASH